MALLSQVAKDKIWGAFMRGLTAGELPVCLKVDVQAAIDATDSWIESNTTSFNNALPAKFRNNASSVDKTLLFCYVALKRAGLTVPREE